MYGVLPYFLGKWIMDMPALLGTPLIFEIITYFGIGLTWDAGKFFYFFLINAMLAQCGSAIGYFLSGIFEKHENALVIGTVFLLPMFMFGGLLSNVGTLPKWISWF